MPLYLPQEIELSKASWCNRLEIKVRQKLRKFRGRQGGAKNVLSDSQGNWRWLDGPDLKFREMWSLITSVIAQL